MSPSRKADERTCGLIAAVAKLRRVAKSVSCLASAIQRHGRPSCANALCYRLDTHASLSCKRSLSCKTRVAHSFTIRSVQSGSFVAAYMCPEHTGYVFDCSSGTSQTNFILRVYMFPKYAYVAQFLQPMSICELPALLDRSHTSSLRLLCCNAT